MVITTDTGKGLFPDVTRTNLLTGAVTQVDIEYFSDDEYLRATAIGGTPFEGFKEGGHVYVDDASGRNYVFEVEGPSGGATNVLFLRNEGQLSGNLVLTAAAGDEFSTIDKMAEYENVKISPLTGTSYLQGKVITAETMLDASQGFGIPPIAGENLETIHN